jgi:indole-3-glycerol phosphate synthase
MPKIKGNVIGDRTAGFGGLLAQIVATKEAEVAALRPELAGLRSAARDQPAARDFAGALRRTGEVRLLAEIKRRSPSAGPIRPGAAAAEIAHAYEVGGAAALSVLTDREYFDGSLDALRAVVAVTNLPVIRKDFVIDEAQLWEARAAGADAALLIVGILEQSRLEALSGIAAEAGLQVLIEVHDEVELERALAVGAGLIGVNNRDLRTFSTDLELTTRLAPSVPAEIILVAESGIRSASDVSSLGKAGVDAVLVGESLMRQPDVGLAAARLVGQPKLSR